MGMGLPGIVSATGVEKGNEGMSADPNIIYGRPDFESWRRGEKFGVTRAKKHPPYVFSISGNAALVHKIAYVELHWWRASTLFESGDCLRKNNPPNMVATTVCGASRFLTPARTRTCLIPRPDAIRCTKCFGLPEQSAFGKNGWCTKAGVTRQEAHVKLGCVVEGY